VLFRDFFPENFAKSRSSTWKALGAFRRNSSTAGKFGSLNVLKLIPRDEKFAHFNPEAELENSGQNPEKQQGHH
jgi:hypothetical protein